MHNYQTCWVRYPLWEAIADCRCNLHYNPKYRVKNGKAHFPKEKPANLPDSEGWVNNVTYEESLKEMTVSNGSYYVEAKISFHLARPFVNSQKKKYYLGNKNGVWKFFDNNNQLISSFQVYNNPDKTQIIFPIPIPDNCYRIECHLNSKQETFGSYQYNLNGKTKRMSKFNRVKNIVSRLPLLVNTYKCLNQNIYGSEVQGENIGSGKFFIQHNQSQGMVELFHPALGTNQPYYVRNKFSGSDLWRQMQTQHITYIVRHKQHPSLSCNSMIDVLWKSDVFLRMVHPKGYTHTSTKSNVIRPDAVEHSLFEITGQMLPTWKTVSSPALKRIPFILTGRNMNNFYSRTENVQTQAHGMSSEYATDIKRAGFGYGFVRNKNITGKGNTIANYNISNPEEPISFYLFVYLFPYKRHKRTRYRNSLNCQWRMFEPPIAKGKFKMKWMPNLTSPSLMLMSKNLL